MRRAIGAGIWVLVLVGMLAATPAAMATEDRLSDWMQRMTLEEKVGQLFMVHAFGPSLDDPAFLAENLALHGLETVQQVIDVYKPGGFIYFNWTENVENPRQLARLSNGLQEVALGWRTPIPLLIAVDQEHGSVRRVGPPAAEFPGSMALGATGDPDLAELAALITGKELRAMGVHVNFAPVADVNVNPQNPVIGARSFGDRSSQVSEFVARQTAGFREGGVAAAAKHFPGHGDTDVDSHSGLPLIHRALDELQTVDLPPFQAAIDAGADMVMTAHIVVPALDGSGVPATMSRPILTELLREAMGFKGIVVTDALTMAGAQVTFDPRRVPVEAIKAGADLLLMPPDLQTAFEAVVEAVKSGELSEKRIDQSVRRILALKMDLGLFDDAFVDEDAVDIAVGAAEHWAVAQEAADRSVTLIKNVGRMLPIDPNSLHRVLITGWGENATRELAAIVAERGPKTTAHPVGAAPTSEAINRAVAAANDVDLVILTTMNAAQDSMQTTLARALKATGVPVVAAALGAPYDAAALDFLDAIVVTYGYRGISLEAMVRVLFGEVHPTGTLPVAVVSPDNPGRLHYPVGHGLSYVSAEAGLVEGRLPVEKALSHAVAREIQVRYPQIEDWKVHFERPDVVNEAIREAALALVDELTMFGNVWGDFEVHLDQDGLLSVTLTYSGYHPPMAHPMHYRASITGDLNAGRVMDLADLFVDESYVETLSSIVRRRIAEEELPTLIDFERIRPDQDFYLTQDGLVLYFQLYELAPYAWGFPEFVIPWEALELIARRPGAWPVVR